MEKNYEHRQLGKNNMYDAASRVAMLLSGPGILPNQIINVTSLNDVFPTVILQWSNRSRNILLGRLSISANEKQQNTPNCEPQQDAVTTLLHSTTQYSVTGEFRYGRGITN